MDRQELLKRLLSTFLDELEDHVASWNRDLLALEDAASESERDELLHAIFRTAHSVKGAARVVKIEILERACHQLESLMGRVRAGELELTQARVELLFAAGDALQEAASELRAERPLDDSSIARLLPAFEAAAAGQSFDLDARPRPPATHRAPDKTEPEPTSTPAPAAADATTIRVASDKLDALMAQSGQLLVSSRRLTELEDMAQQLADLVTTWQATRDDGERSGRHRAQLLRSSPSRGRRSPRAARLTQTGGRLSAEDGELLSQLGKGLDRLIATLARDGRQITQSARSLDERVQGLRMTPFAGACQGLERSIRDLCRSEGKQVAFELVGGDVELDRAVVSQLVDPLRHLVRNAVSHGIEPIDDRIAAGKPPEAHITVAAELRGAQVEISVSDDGRGLDLNVIREKARQRHLVVPQDESELSRLIFQPGFSTAPIITDVSGRGVGLDVVRTRVESLHGTVGVSYTPGRGTVFHLLVPLTISTIRALLVEAWGHRFALPSTNIDQLRRLMPDDVISVEGREMMMVDDKPVPLASLGETLGLSRPEDAEHLPPIPVTVLTSSTHRMAFLVDELIGEQEVLVKGLGPRLRRVPNVGGATILPTGDVVLILNTAELIRNAYRTAVADAFSEAIPTDHDSQRRVLVVDDSITTRTLERTILEAAGFDVVVASDGVQAWELLHHTGADLVVADVEMPRMDGFKLTKAIRETRRFRDIPVVLVTTLESDAHKTQGLEVGANAYLVKSAFDQRTLLATIRQLL